jgi:HD-GYP domain-containing protein (c-di-GMP phosphodiesterase class II)
MIPNAITPDAVCPVTPLIQRCESLGAPVWRFDASGTVIKPPATPGVLGLWLRSGQMTEMLRARVGAWLETGDHGFTELFPGCWLLPIEERSRRKTSGFTVAMALGQQVVDTPEFEACCRSASIDRAAARKAALDAARMERDESERTLSLLRWMHEDLQAYAKGQTALESFTTQLSESYETINTVYEIGRSMSGLDEPDRFVELLIDRVRSTLGFGWTAVVLTAETESEAPTTFVSGAPACDELVLRSAIDSVEHDASFDRCTIGTIGPEFPEALGPQLVVRSLGREGKHFGLLAAGSKGGIDPQISSYETLLLEASGGFLTAFLENVDLYEDQRRTFMGTVQAMTAAIDAKDRYTRGHSERVAYLSREIAKAIGLDENECERIHVSGLVHDVGKIGVAEKVLCKPGRLTDDEFAQIREHPVIGRRILEGIPALQDILPGVTHHHERIDGRGYPDGLAGLEIPLMARIIGVADTFDAMSSTRSYRPAMNRDQVLEEMRRSAGTQLDETLVEAFLTLDLSRYDQMVREHAGPIRIFRGSEAA